MFKCQRCGKVTAPYENENKVTIIKRPVSYSNMVKNKNDRLEEKITQGYEIEKEISVCEKCFKEMEEK